MARDEKGKLLPYVLVAEGASATVRAFCVEHDYHSLGRGLPKPLPSACGLLRSTFDYKSRRAIWAQASASARAWWWRVRSKPQAAATVWSW